MEEEKSQQQSQQQTAPPAPISEEEKKDIAENKGIALLSYLPILFLIPLFGKKDSKFSKFHAKQGLVLSIAWLFVPIPFLGWFLWIALILFSIWGIMNVLAGKYAELPIVGDIAKKFNI